MTVVPRGSPKVCSETSQEKGWVALLQVSKGATLKNRQWLRGIQTSLRGRCEKNLRQCKLFSGTYLAPRTMS